MNNTKAVQEMLNKIKNNSNHALVLIAQANLFLERENMLPFDKCHENGEPLYTEEQKKEFEALVAPLMNYISKHPPAYKILITATSAEIIATDLLIQSNDYLAD